MKNTTLGAMIATARKEKGMTQLDLANKLGVTDKAVSKWERDLCCPDIHTLPKLAQLLDLTVDQLVQTESKPEPIGRKNAEKLLDMILKAMPLAMGIALIVTSVLKKDLDLYTIAGFAGIGLLSISLHQLVTQKN